MLKVAVLISGRGSNLQSLIDAAKAPGYPAQIVCVISNEPGVFGLKRAEEAGIPAITINHRDFNKDREAFEKALDAKINEYGVQLVCLAGFMRLLTPWFIDRWLDRLVNIHPSLLPAFPGLHVQQKAIDYGARFSGCTIHFVRAEMDHGPIIVQAAVPVLQNDTESTLAARILESEHKMYPLAVRMIAEGRVNVHGERVFIAGAEEQTTSLLNPGGTGQS
ncbi:MAG: phosphoribosylglycinamide formyltransferase [Alphaproteobacteria bacterium]|nr:phosphoribosylglycinamide formyltransferase [Alphaproteobacteria bacterium]